MTTDQFKDLLLNAVISGADKWNETSSITVEEAITESALKLLSDIGLSPELVDKLITKDAHVFPVKNYRHYKGDFYVEVGRGINTDNLRKGVFYYSPKDDKWYDRPADDFDSDTEDGTTARFTLLNDVATYDTVVNALRFTDPPSSMPTRVVNNYRDKGWRYCCTRGYITKGALQILIDNFGLIDFTYNIVQRDKIDDVFSVAFFINDTCYERYMALQKG